MDNNKNNQEQMIKSLPHTPNVLSSFNQQQRNNNKWPKIIDAENDLIHKHGTNN